MRRHIPGLHSRDQNQESQLQGLFLVRVDGASLPLASAQTFLLAPLRDRGARTVSTRSFSGRLCCSERALWKLNWFLRDFSYDPELLGRDQVDEKALLNLRGVLRTSPIAFNGHSYQNLESFAPAGEWEELSCATVNEIPKQGNVDDL